ncbi:MAG: tetratricopeptide repeat protein [Candidatus Eisenbacteria sp.]|nr:tetratricopeptide repeat protein [Candidatus Eisenbacteria bacterium]
MSTTNPRSTAFAGRRAIFHDLNKLREHNGLYPPHRQTPPPFARLGRPSPTLGIRRRPAHPPAARAPQAGRARPFRRWAYELQGDYAAAEPLYTWALAIMQSCLGPDHPDAATSLTNLAGSIRSSASTRPRTPCTPAFCHY